MILWRIGRRVYTTRNSRALSDMVCDSPKRLMILWRIGLSFFTTRNSRDLSYIFAIPQEASKSRKNWVSFDNLEFRTLSDMFPNVQKRFMILWRIGFDFTTRNFRAVSDMFVNSPKKWWFFKGDWLISSTTRVAVIAAAAVADLSATIFSHQTVIRDWHGCRTMKSRSIRPHSKVEKKAPPWKLQQTKKRWSLKSMYQQLDTDLQSTSSPSTVVRDSLSLLTICISLLFSSLLFLQKSSEFPKVHAISKLLL